MIIMSVDLGKARTGIAISDAGENFAFPKRVINEYTTEKIVAAAAAAAKEYGAEMIVVGNPKNMNGTCGEKSEECTAFAELLREATGLPVEMFDERCTTVIAHAEMHSNGKRGQKRKATVDAVAATVILEDYLKFRKNKIV